ncbi:hypothetical protein M422DRAFT_47906 [Sphaerobolus stellatus SS14]|uniref:DUF6533 domain-containing protein n=1 Tax=Sphaerobolus stellatus (strain SS14) TaxID=990650 RepID=A0A0C9VMS5_SPHS4|nr:hypothetical protein M422DRAFT_47906 [Sphaerobolus stellatus SS14]
MFEALATSASSYGSGIPSIIPSSNVVAASVVIFYDYILSLDDEIEFIWKYVLRSVARSQPLIIFRIKGKSILGDRAELEFFAYYGRKSSVLIGLGTLLIGNIATAGGLVVFSLRDNNLIPNNDPAFHAGPCIGHSISNRYSSVWILPLSIHCIVILLVAARYLKGKILSGSNGPRLLSIFVWDHTWVFGAVLGMA